VHVARYIPALEDAAIPVGDTPVICHPTRGELTRHLRAHSRTNLFDESGAGAGKVAIYALSDPRDIRDTRYIGQTSAPPNRFLQHMNAARLWLPDTLPWWVQSPQLRPLYCWIRTLYSDERRLPVMVITAWTESLKEARSAERARIIECLQQGRDLFNIEKETFPPQLCS
jgi:hypothetical protein